MGLLNALGLLATGATLGCYSPAFPDCAVSCAASTDCAADQVCGADHFCATAELAGRCADVANDAGLTPDAVDAAGLDAAPDAPPDARPLINLRVTIMGKGKVVLAGGAMCASGAPQNGNCTFPIELGTPQQLQAVETHMHERFVGWTSLVCNGTSPTCTITPLTATLTTARFARADD